MEKIKVGIIGTGNIGSDLLVKVQKSELLECGISAGHNPYSDGIRRAQEMGVPTTFDSVRYIEDHPDCCQIVFDAIFIIIHGIEVYFGFDFVILHIGDCFAAFKSFVCIGSKHFSIVLTCISVLDFCKIGAC